MTDLADNDVVIVEAARAPLGRRNGGLATVHPVDLLAAVPSLIYGLWGLVFLQPHLLGVSKWLSTHVSFIPIFKTTTPDFKASSFVAGVVVALVIVVDALATPLPEAESFPAPTPPMVSFSAVDVWPLLTTPSAHGVPIVTFDV